MPKGKKEKSDKNTADNLQRSVEAQIAGATDHAKGLNDEFSRRDIRRGTRDLVRKAQQIKKSGPEGITLSPAEQHLVDEKRDRYKEFDTQHDALKSATYEHKMAELHRQAREEERAAEAAEMESLKPKKK
jgi:hypothetical protein